MCAAVAGALFQSSAKRVTIVVAAKSLAAGTVLVPADIATATIPASGHITAMSAAGSSALVGQQLDTPVYAGQVMVRQMLRAPPNWGRANRSGMSMKGDHSFGAPEAGDAVQVVVVPQPGQGSTVGERSARRWWPEPPCCGGSGPHEPDPVRGLRLTRGAQYRRRHRHRLCRGRPDRAPLVSEGQK